MTLQLLPAPDPVRPLGKCLAALLLAGAALAQDEPRPAPVGPPRSGVEGIEERFSLAPQFSGDWSSEDRGALAGELLGGLGAAWEQQRLGAEPLDWVADAATIEALRPDVLVENGGGTFTHRSNAAARSSGEERRLVPLEGPAGLVAAFGELDGLFDPPRRAHFKITSVLEGEGVVRTGVAATFCGTRPSKEATDGLTERPSQEASELPSIWEAHVELDVVWQLAPSGGGGGVPSELALVALGVGRYSESGGRSGVLFQDVTGALLAGEPALREELARGLEHWRARLDTSLGVGLLGHHGVAVGDVNGDGLEDLYLGQPGGLRNLLLLARPEGGFSEAEGSGVDLLDSTRGALIIDLDGDDDRDLVMGTGDEVLFHENDGAGLFQLRAALAVPSVTSLAAADFDGDGDLDVYACGYVTPFSDEATPVPYHDANNGQPNSLLVNAGDWRFLDRTAALGLEVNNRRFSFAASWEDHDGDGDPDLYVANDFGRNNLYRNDGGRFTDIAGEAGVEDISAGMGVSWGDHDGDGRLDVYVSNMFSSAGQRIAYQRRFKSQADSSTREGFQRHARGNSLFRNNGDGTFSDVTVAANVWMGRWSWGAGFTDFDNDGAADLFVPNGFITNEDSKDL